MYCLLISCVLLSITDWSFAQNPTPTLCQNVSGKYCRPPIPRKYGSPHNNYRGSGQIAPVPPSPTTNPTPSTGNVDEDLVQNLIAAESAIRRFCLENSIGDVKEIYRNVDYVLNYTLVGQEQKDVSIQIKHTVIDVTVKNAGVTIVRDIRILPNIVDTGKASWSLGSSFLEVYIPYAVLNANKLDKCNTVSETLIKVPESTFTYRFADGVQGNFQPNFGSNLYINPDTDTAKVTNRPDVQVTNSPVENNDGIDEAMNTIFGSSDNQQ